MANDTSINYYKKIARILRADKDTVATVREDVVRKIVEENERIIEAKLSVLSPKTRGASDIYRFLLNKVEEDDKKLSEALNRPVCDTEKGCRGLLDAVERAAGVGKGFFIKEEKAKELLFDVPPKNILRGLGYGNMGDLLENENVFEIFSALRFMEDGEWLNNIFFKQYEKLIPEDFEEREIKMIVLGDRWKDVAEKFLKKKYHNISHLKELGVIFVLPAVLGIKGETLRTAALVLHYRYEIDFYSKLFRKHSDKDNFAERLVGFLRGDVPDEKVPEADLGKKWMIVQRYLAKDDENDWRLFEPHVNPEAVHWKKTEDGISKIGGIVDSVDLSFWRDVGFVGDFYPTGAGADVLVSFNLVDTVMSLVRRKEMIKYLYHHQEALWNEIFSEIVGSEEKMEEMIIDNFEKGYIEL
ncbi:hypothetical protein KKA27_01960 [Patescibacteria group bacterium]|nr:hypothetical protein [Patescibacteria group bacterium]MBU2633214.1 hypothetical protein [Patescibacteria group bacterium]